MITLFVALAGRWFCIDTFLKCMVLYNYHHADWGQDAVLGYKLRNTDKKIMIDWSIFCRHHDESGKVFE